MIDERRRYLRYDTNNYSYLLQSLLPLTGCFFLLTKYLSLLIGLRLNERRRGTIEARCIFNWLAIVAFDVPFPKYIIHLGDPLTVGWLHAQ